MGQAKPADMSARIAEAEAAVAALADQFIPWAKEDLEKLRAKTAEAREAPQEHARIVPEIFDLAHNVKGQGGSFGFHLLTKIGHSLCELTREREHMEPGELDVVDHHIKAMAVVLDNRITGEGGEAGTRLIAKLTAMVEATRG